MNITLVKINECEQIWKELFRKIDNKNPFLSFQWFEAITEHIIKDNPEIFLFKEDSPLGILPACIKNSVIVPVADKRITDLTGLISLKSHEDKIIRELNSFTEKENLKIDLYPLSRDNISVRKLTEHFSDLNVEISNIMPILKLPSTVEKYLSELDGKSRHELRRKERKGRRLSLQSVKPGDIKILFDLMEKSSMKKKEFLSPDIKEFFKKIAFLFFREGWLRLKVAFIGDIPAACIFAFQMNSKIYLYNTGYNPEFHILSPGINSIFMDIKKAIESGYTVYNFLRGDERFKFKFGAKKYKTMRIKN